MSFTLSAKTVAVVPQAKAFKGLTKASAPVAKVSNAKVANEMMVWTPFNNKNFETFSFLPPLTDIEISKQVDYIVANGWTPCLEFAPEDQAYVSSENTIRFGGSASCNYYDNRYWTMWKLPMFGCNDASQVLGEVAACTSAFEDCYVRLVAFDAIVQCQTVSFLVHRPSSATDYTEAAYRSIQG